MSAAGLALWLVALMRSGTPGAPSPPGEIPIVDVHVSEFKASGNYEITATIKF